MIKQSLASMRKEANCSYLGATKHSAKMRYSFNEGVETYCVYLAPADMSGYNVCPNSKFCKENCLNAAGHNKADILAHGNELSKINQARVKKTKLFFENKDLFMRLLIAEITSAKRNAEKNNRGFAVRLNGTSDISPEDFVYEGKNILEWFPDVQFYDYTKVPTRFPLIEKYPNYDITFSYNGFNWNTCEKFLKMGGKVAVVFASERMPKTFNGYKVENGNSYDMRYLNSPSSIIYLHYHPTANDYIIDEKTKKHTLVIPNTKFIVKPTDERIIF